MDWEPARPMAAPPLTSSGPAMFSTTARRTTATTPGGMTASSLMPTTAGAASGPRRHELFRPLNASAAAGGESLGERSLARSSPFFGQGQQQHHHQHQHTPPPEMVVARLVLEGVPRELSPAASAAKKARWSVSAYRVDERRVGAAAADPSLRAELRREMRQHLPGGGLDDDDEDDDVGGKNTQFEGILFGRRRPAEENMLGRRRPGDIGPQRQLGHQPLFPQPQPQPQDELPLMPGSFPGAPDPRAYPLAPAGGEVGMGIPRRLKRKLDEFCEQVRQSPLTPSFQHTHIHTYTYTNKQFIRRA